MARSEAFVPAYLLSREDVEEATREAKAFSFPELMTSGPQALLRELAAMGLMIGTAQVARKSERKARSRGRKST